MNNEELAQFGIFRESRLAVEVQANIIHVTPDAREAHVEVAKQHVEAVRARYETPVRITMRYLLAAIGVLLGFMLLVVVLAKVFELDTDIVIVVVIVAGAAVAAPLGILLSKIAARVLPALPAPADKKD